MQYQFKITGWGYYLPPNIETAEQLSKKINKSSDWIISRAGVKERRVSEIDVDKMGAIAAKEAIGNKPAPDLIINAAAKQGASAGQAKALSSLKNSRSARSRVGL